jgi:hypothetical protein
MCWKSSSLCYNDYVGEELPLSAFCRTSVCEWDTFRSIDMDTEVCSMLVPVLIPHAITIWFSEMYRKITFVFTLLSQYVLVSYTLQPFLFVGKIDATHEKIIGETEDSCR